MLKRVFIPTTQPQPIPGIYTFPDHQSGPFPAVLMIHGFMAYKEGDGFLLTKMAEVLAKAGMASLRIDCTSMGENRNDRANYDMPHLMQDVAAAFADLKKQPEVDVNRLGLIGHSLGGRLVTLNYNLDPAFIITLNGALFLTPTKIHEKDFTNQDYAIIATSDGRHELLYRNFSDLQAGYDVKETLVNYQKYFCVCVGKQDPTVNPQVSLDFYNKLQTPNKKLIEIEDANHTFNAKTGDYTKILETAEKVKDWLQEIGMLA